MKEGFALKSFLIIIGISMIIILTVFLIQKRSAEIPQTESVAELYNEYIENQIIDGPEEEIEGVEEEPAEESLIEVVGETDILPVSKAKKSLALRLNIDSSEIKLESAEAVIFSDSTLGTSAPGEVFGQKLTPGYLIVLSALGKDYRYHADESRAIFIGENL